MPNQAKPPQQILPDRVAPGSAQPNQAGEKNGVIYAADGQTQKGQPAQAALFVGFLPAYKGGA